MKTLEQKAREYANNQMRCYKCSDHQAPCKDNKCVNWHRCFKGYKQGYTEALRWRDVNEEPIPVDEEVIAKSAKWVDEDFNPRGIRVGFMTDHGFISAKWVDYHDCYMDRCSGDNTDEMPTHWRPIETI